MGNLAYNAIDGVLRAIFFFAYILSISLMEEIRRVFQYHGAEHKTVYTFEANEDLTVENARTKSTLHPRCGTSFLMFVMAISILVFSLVPSTAPFLVKFGARVVLIPLIAGLAYEIIRFSARHLDSAVCRTLIQPGPLAAADHDQGAGRPAARDRDRGAERGADVRRRRARTSRRRLA